jgi:hypothetical protein
MVAGIPKEAAQDVYTAAITKAGTDKEQWQLSNAFVAAFAQLDSAKDSDKLLESLLHAVDYTITFNGCEAPKAFAKSKCWGSIQLWADVLAPGVEREL